MDSQTPLVSILLITMNHQNFIKQACLSALNQTHRNVEIIFLVNFSKDDTAEIAKKTLENSKTSFVFIKNDKSFGVAKNLNKMVQHASGEYIAILSGDDWWNEKMIEEKVKFMQKGNFGLVLSDGYKYIQDTSQTVPAYAEKEKRNIIDTLPKFFHENVTGNKTVNVGTFTTRKLLLEYPFDENINTEDWDMNLRMTNLGFEVGFLDKKLFHYRVLSTSLSRKWAIMQDSYNKVTYKYLGYIKQHPELHKTYLINKLQFKYEILLQDVNSEKERQKLHKDWKIEKYKLKYKNPLLFFKLLFMR